MKRLLTKAFIMIFLISFFPIEDQVNADYINITDISLKRCLNLNLGLGDVTTDISAEQMLSLSEVVCNEMGINDLSGIEHATNVTLLSMYGNNISDLSMLSSLTNLTSLTLHNNNISSISSLQYLSKLELLHLDNNHISDLSAIANLTSLKYLYLANNNISDVSNLSKLTRLIELFLQNNRISDISAFERLTSLRWVSIDNNSISDISSFANISNLNGLYAANNNISDISALKNKYELNELYLNGNKIGDISPIGSSKKIYAIGLGNQRVETAPIYVSDNMGEYPNMSTTVKLDNGKKHTVEQSYVSSSHLYSGQFSKSAYKGKTTYSGTVTTNLLLPNPDVDALVTTTSFTTEERYAPTSQSELFSLFELSAYDPLLSTDITNDVKVYSVDGYNYDAPQVGEYNFIFSIVGSSGNLIYYGETLTVMPTANNNQFVFTSQIISDADADLALNKSETVEYEVTITNNNAIDIISPTLTYKVNANYLNNRTITSVASGDVTSEVLDGQIVLTPRRFNHGDVITFTYQVTANDTWYIDDLESNLQSFNNKLNVAFSEESYNFTSATNLIESAFTSLLNTFSISDQSANGLLTTDESVNFKYNISNHSLYSISKYKLRHAEVSTHLVHNISNLQITSNLRTLVLGVDYEIEAETQINVFEVLPNEQIEVTFSLQSKKTFASSNDLSINSYYDIYNANQSAVVFTKTNSSVMSVDIADAYDVSFNATITDDNDDLVLTSEPLSVEFEIKNSGTIDATNAKVTIDLTDLNIAENTLTNEMVILKVVATNSLVNLRILSTVENNTITIPRIAAGQIIKGEILLTAKSTFKVSEFSDELSAISINENLTYTDDNSNIVKPLTIPIDYANLAKLNSNVTAVETSGDSDGLVDANETWEYHLNLDNVGTIDLDGLQILLDLDYNNGLTIASVDVSVVNELDETLSDISYQNNQLTINKFLAHQKLKVIVTVTYSNELSSKTTNNSFNLSHSYLENVQLEKDLNIDLLNNQRITMTTTQSTTSIGRSEQVDYVATIKNEGSTNEKLLVFTYNYDQLNMVGNQLLDVSLNDGALVENQDYILTGNTIIINRLAIDDEVIVKFSVKSKSSFTTSLVAGANLVIKNSTAVTAQTGMHITNDLELTPNFGVVDYEITSSILTSDESTTAAVDEELVVKVTITNGNAVNLTNNTLTIDLSDVDVSSLNTVKVTSANPDFSYSVDGNTITVFDIAINETVDFEISLIAASTFDTSATIDLPITFTNDFFTDSQLLTIDKTLETEITNSSKLLATSSGNLLIGSNETFNYQLVLKNEGNVNLDSLTVTTDLANQNLTSQLLVAVKDENSNDLSSSVTYNDNQLIINNFNVGDEIIIEYQVQTASSIVFEEDFKLDNTLTASGFTEVNSLPLAIDLSGVSTLAVAIDYANASGETTLSPNDIYNTTITVENSDGVAVNDVYIKILTSDVNVDSNYSNLVVTDQNGVVLTQDTDYYVSGTQLHLPVVDGNSKVIVTYSNQMKSTFEEREQANFKVSVKANYPGIGEKELINENKVMLNLDDYIDYTFNITSDNTAVIPADIITFTIELTNSGSVNLEDLELIPVVDANLDYTTLVVDSNDSTKATVDNGKVIVNRLNANSSQTIKFTISSNSTFNASSVITLKYKSTDVSATKTLDINRTSAVITPTLNLREVTGDGDNLVDNQEVFGATLVLKNSSDFQINNLVITNVSNDVNIVSRDSFTTFTPDENGQIVIASIPANSQVTIKYNLTIAEFLSSASSIEEKFNVAYESTTNNVSSSLNIDVNALSSVASTFTVSDANNNGLAEASEVLTYTYTVTNNGNRTLDASKLVVPLADVNLDDDLTVVSYEINGVDSSYLYDDTLNEFTIASLKPNDSIKLVYSVVTKSSLQHSIIRLLNISIVNTMMFTDSNNLVTDTKVAKIKVSTDVVKLTTSSSITDSDSNGMLNPSEQFTYEMTMKNTGSFVLTNLEVVHLMYGENYIPGYTLTISDQDNNLLVENTDYELVDSTLTFYQLQPGDEITISAQFSAKASFNLSSQTEIAATVSSNDISTQDLLATIPNDFNVRNITTSLTVDDSSVFSADKIGEKYYYRFTLTNNGQTVEEDIVLARETDNQNLTYVANDYVLEINGVDYSNEIRAVDGVLVLPRVNPSDVITVEYAATINESLANDDVLDPSLDIVANATTSLSDQTSYDVSYSNSIDKSTITDVLVTSKLSEATKVNDLANPTEKLQGQVKLHVLGNLEQSNLTTTINLDSMNANYSTLVIARVVDKNNQELTLDKYFVNDNVVTIKNVKYLDEYTITYNYEVKATISYSLPLSSQITLVDSYVVDINYGSSISSSAQILVDKSISVLEYTSTINDANGNNDGMAQAGEVLTAVNRITNTGKLVEQNVVLQSSSSDDDYDLTTVSNLNVTRNGVNLTIGIDYSVNTSIMEITIFEVNPDDVIEVIFDVNAQNTLHDKPYIHGEGMLTSGLGNVCVEGAEFPIDIMGASNITINELYTDDDDLIVSNGETLKYMTTFTNDGSINYELIHIDLDFSTAQFDASSAVITIDGANTSKVVYQLDIDLAFYDIKISDFIVGEEYTITVTYVPLNVEKFATLDVKSMYETNILTINNVQSLQTEFYDDNTGVDKEDPYITGNSNATTQEGTVIDNLKLLSLFNIESNDHSGKKMEITHQIDTNQAGSYEVVFTLTDDVSGKQARFVGELLVTDVYPTISGDAVVSINKGEQVTSYLKSFNIVATELVSGDLNSNVIVDHQSVDINVAGEYDIIFKVSDNEGNQVMFSAKLVVKDTIVKTGSISYFVPVLLVLLLLLGIKRRILSK